MGLLNHDYRPNFRNFPSIPQNTLHRCIFHKRQAVSTPQGAWWPSKYKSKCKRKSAEGHSCDKLFVYVLLHSTLLSSILLSKWIETETKPAVVVHINEYEHRFCYKATISDDFDVHLLELYKSPSDEVPLMYPHAKGSHTYVKDPVFHIIVRWIVEISK